MVPQEIYKLIEKCPDYKWLFDWSKNKSALIGATTRKESNELITVQVKIVITSGGRKGNGEPSGIANYVSIA